MAGVFTAVAHDQPSTYTLATVYPLPVGSAIVEHAFVYPMQQSAYRGRPWGWAVIRFVNRGAARSWLTATGLGDFGIYTLRPDAEAAIRAAALAAWGRLFPEEQHSYYAPLVAPKRRRLPIIPTVKAGRL